MIDKSDPRLTAFVLGELSPEEFADVEQAIDSSPELLAEIEAIRTTVSLLNEGFAADETPHQLSTRQSATLRR